MIWVNNPIWRHIAIIFLTTLNRFRRPRLRLLCTGRYCAVFCLLVILHKKLEHLEYLTPMKSGNSNRITWKIACFIWIWYASLRGLSLDACSVCYFDSTLRIRAQDSESLNKVYKGCPLFISSTVSDLACFVFVNSSVTWQIRLESDPWVGS